MIDFSQYPEKPEFIIPYKDIEDTGNPIPAFSEILFDEKNSRYIEYLKQKTQNLKSILQSAISGYLAETDSGIQSLYGAEFSQARQWLKDLNSIPPEVYFMRSTPKNNNAFCFGVDAAYDFYRSVPNYTSKLQGLETYEEYFTEMFPEVYEILNQVFNVIGTRGQLYGYTEGVIIDYGTSLENTAAILGMETNYQMILNEVPANRALYDTYTNDYTTNILQAGDDIRSLIEPIVTYMNLIQLSNSIMISTWGNIRASGLIKQVYDKYGIDVINSDDLTIKSKAIASQITSNISQYIKEDSSNFELMLVKAVKLAMNEIDLRNKLIANRASLINPGY